MQGIRRHLCVATNVLLFVPTTLLAQDVSSSNASGSGIIDWLLVPSLAGVPRGVLFGLGAVIVLLVTYWITGRTQKSAGKQESFADTESTVQTPPKAETTTPAPVRAEASQAQSSPVATSEPDYDADEAGVTQEIEAPNFAALPGNGLLQQANAAVGQGGDDEDVDCTEVLSPLGADDVDSEDEDDLGCTQVLSPLEEGVDYNNYLKGDGDDKSKKSIMQELEELMES